MNYKYIFQFKEEAGLANLKYHFLVAGVLLILFGLLLLCVKCVWFRKPLPFVDEDDDVPPPPPSISAKQNNASGSPAHSDNRKPPAITVEEEVETELIDGACKRLKYIMSRFRP